MRSVAHTALFLIVSLLFAGSARTAEPASVSEGHLRSFRLAVCDYFKMPEKEVAAVSDQRVPDDELPVLFYLSQRAGVTSQTVIDLRKVGRSYLEITLLFQLSPAIYYVPIKTDPVPPFGKAYGQFKKRSKSEWKQVELADDDIINLANLRFISNHCRVAPEDVMKLRGSNKSYVLVHDDAIQFAAEAKKKSDAPKALNFADKKKGPKPK